MKDSEKDYLYHNFYEIKTRMERCTCDKCKKYIDDLQIKYDEINKEEYENTASW